MARDPDCILVKRVGAIENMVIFVACCSIINLAGELIDGSLKQTPQKQQKRFTLSKITC